MPIQNGRVALGSRVFPIEYFLDGIKPQDLFLTRQRRHPDPVNQPFPVHDARVNLADRIKDKKPESRDRPRFGLFAVRNAVERWR